VSAPLEAVAQALYEAFARAQYDVQAFRAPPWELLAPSRQLMWRGVAREACEMSPQLVEIAKVLR
jgi:hypothetical protein